MERKLSNLIARRETDDPAEACEIEYCYEQLVTGVCDGIEHALAEPSSGAYSALENLVDTLRQDLRESVQGLTKKSIWHIIQRLREGHDLTGGQLDLVRLWVIGDADAYVHEENNYSDWIAELSRLHTEIERRRGADLEPHQLRELQALLTDAHGVILNLASFLTSRERVQHFEKTMARSLDHESRHMLADILARSLHSAQA